MQIFDPRYQTWDSWASLMVETYSAQQLTIPTDESEWKDWATGLLAIDVFLNDAVPSPDGFSDWQDWAFALIHAVSPSID